VAKRKRRAPSTPAAPRPRPINKARDLLTADQAALSGWLGQHHALPPGPPYPWEALLPDDLALFDRAVGRLVLGGVPRPVAQAMCWARGAWAPACTRIVTAQAVQVFPERQHVRLIPASSLQREPEERVARSYLLPDDR